MRKSRRGRRRSSEIQVDRVKHVMAAVMLNIRRVPWRDCCWILDIARSTLYKWVKLALGYPEYLVEERKAFGLLPT